jgi:hypothetical protein
MLEAGRPESWEANINLILCFLVLRLPSSLPFSITVSLHSSFLACRPPAPDGFGHLNFDPFLKSISTSFDVIPAKAGIQCFQIVLDACLRRHDGISDLFRLNPIEFDLAMAYAGS